MLHYLIEKVSEPCLVCCGDREGISQPETVKFIDLRHGQIAVLIHLVDDKNHWFSCTPEHIRDFAVSIDKALLYIRHEQNDIRHVDGDLRLLPHLRQNHIPGVRFNAPGVDQRKSIIQPGAVRIDAVAGDARSVFHNGNIFSRKFIKQCRFSHIRPSYNGDERTGCLFAHNISCPHLPLSCGADSS